MKKATLWIGVALLVFGLWIAGFLLWNREGEGSESAEVLEPVGFSGKDGVPVEVFTVSAGANYSETTASSQLPYDPVNHLAYNPGYAVDGYWDTAWCTAEVNPTWTINFDKETDLGNVGIVPGYSESEEAFFKNNRVKTLAIFYNGAVDDKQILTFEDHFGMQFFELNRRSIDRIQVQILETYPGSKYRDNCLAEVDFWSYSVRTTDAEMALNYQAGLSPQNKVCEDGGSYNDERVGTVLLSPEESTEKGRRYLIGDWNLGFWITPDYADYNVFQSDTGLEFSTQTDPGCLPIGDAIGAYLSKQDFEQGLSSGDYLTQGSFNIGPISGTAYREEWFGGDILNYSFDFKNTAFTATSLACPLDTKEACSIRDEDFIHSLLVQLD